MVALAVTGFCKCHALIPPTRWRDKETSWRGFAFGLDVAVVAVLRRSRLPTNLHSQSSGDSPQLQRRNTNITTNTYIAYTCPHYSSTFLEWLCTLSPPIAAFQTPRLSTITRRRDSYPTSLPHLLPSPRHARYGPDTHLP